MADVKEAEQLFLDGEFEKSFEILSELVKDESNGRALYLMGLFYSDAICVRQSDDTFQAYMKKAAASGDILAELYVLEFLGDEADRDAYRKWMKKMRSAKLDRDPFGMYQIGHCYARGLGIKEDWVKALSWYEKAAQKGLVTAACAAGSIYEKGDAKVLNEEKAFRYYSAGAEKGYCYAEAHLGNCLLWGIGTMRDVEKGIAYLERAANHGDGGACNAVGLYYFMEHFEEHDDKKAFHYFKQGADFGDRESYYFLGRCYAHGRGTDVDKAKALACYEKSWDLGFTHAAAVIGILYLDSAASPENAELAFSWSQKAVEVGNLLGLVGLGRCYKDGIGTEVDKEKAKKYLKEADEAGELEATCLLGEIALEEEKYGDAFRYWQRAAADEHTPAMNRLAMCYAKGLGVPQNLERVKAYLKESDAQGDPDAKRLMEEYLGDQR